MTKFLLTGTYNSGNKGDDAMELSATMALTDRFPDSEIMILSPFPEMDRPFYAPVRVEPCNRRQLIAASIDLIRGLLWRGPPSRLQKSCDLLISAASLCRVSESDVLIDLSGGLCQIKSA